MTYDIRATGGWTDTSPQTGESSMGHVKAILLDSISLSSGAAMPVMAFQHTGYETPLSSLNQDFIVDPKPQMENASYSFDAGHVTDRIKDVLGLSISRQAQLLGVSRTAIYNWRNGEKPSEKNLELLIDLSDTADLFERESVEVTGLLLKRAFIQGKSLLDLLDEGEPIYQPAKTLIAQIKREAEEHSSLARRLGDRSSPRSDAGSDLE
jgi:transcriptional regulator with XRE-family HTH domain